jgi:hypothetical protein
LANRTKLAHKDCCEWSTFGLAWFAYIQMTHAHSSIENERK